MPAAPARKCALPTCTALATYAGRCAKHAAAKDHERGTPPERGYDATWRRFRASFLHEHPLCEDCMEQGFYDTQATEVHHIRKLRDGGARLDPSNCKALCKSCHQKRTARGE